MNPFKRNIREDKKKAIKNMLAMGLKQSHIARILGISRQLVFYWVREIKKNGKAKNKRR